MDKRWVLHVENFANIKSAEVEISPLLCFVGDNNTGKSYMMSLMWGILTLGKDVFPKNASESKSYKLCEDWLNKSLNQIGYSNEFEINDKLLEPTEFLEVQLMASSSFDFFNEKSTDYSQNTAFDEEDLWDEN